MSSSNDQECYKPNQSHIASLANKLGFIGHICYPHEDGTLGLSLLWNGEIHADLRTKSPHHIDVEIKEPGIPVVYRFKGIYGFAARGEGSRTWDLIRALAAKNCDLPWQMAGDFNKIFCQADKSGGAPRAAAPMAAFRHTMTDCGLLDTGFIGSRFTWSNNYTKECLDRSFHSVSLRSLYPFSRTLTLSPNESDHYPILVELRAEKGRFMKPKRSFRFEKMWHGGMSIAYYSKAVGDSYNR